MGKINFLRASLVGILIGVSVFFYFSFFSSSNEMISEKCKATFEYQNNDAKLLMYVNARMFLIGNNNGFIDLSGDVFVDKKLHKLSRTFAFIYTKDSNDYFVLKDIQMQKQSIDNLNDDYLNANFFDVRSSKNRYIKIQNLNNALIVGNIHAPVFICVKGD